MSDRVERNRESTISVRVIQGLIDAVAAAGVDRQRFLAAAKITPSLLHDGSTRFTRTEGLRLCELALNLTGDAAFGLHWGESYSDSTFTPLSHLIAHSSNLRAGFQTLFDYQPLMTDETRYELREEGDFVTLRLSSLPEAPPRVRTFVVEMEAVGIYRLLRSFGADVRPEHVDFAYKAPAHSAEYTRVFQGVERFEQTYSALTFRRSLMNAVPPHKDDDVRSALQSIASRRVLHLTKQTPYALRVREQLVKLGPRGRSDMKRAAQALGMSVRSLRRRLEAEGTPFNTIANDAAAMLAKQLLEEKGNSIKETAFAMGFAEVSGFHRAFKRWTGVTPCEYLDGQTSLMGGVSAASVRDTSSRRVATVERELPTVLVESQYESASQ